MDFHELNNFLAVAFKIRQFVLIQTRIFDSNAPFFSILLSFDCFVRITVSLLCILHTAAIWVNRLRLADKGNDNYTSNSLSMLSTSHQTLWIVNSLVFLYDSEVLQSLTQVLFLPLDSVTSDGDLFNIITITVFINQPTNHPIYSMHIVHSTYAIAFRIQIKMLIFSEFFFMFFLFL